MADLSTYRPSVTPTHSAGRGGMRGALVQGPLYAFMPSLLYRSNYTIMLMQISWSGSRHWLQQIPMWYSSGNWNDSAIVSFHKYNQELLTGGKLICNHSLQ
jgi:hypothetical protein